MNKKIQDRIKSLASINVDKYVRKTSGKCEENTKIKIVIPLLELLGYNSLKDMDFEHHVENKKADIALLFENKPKLLIETKDLDEPLDTHIHQALNYAFDKGIEWVILTNGLEIRLYKSFIPNIPHKDRLLFTTKLQNLPQSFNTLLELVGKKHLREAKKITKKVEKIRENITAKILIEDLFMCRKQLFNDLLYQFKKRYASDKKFKETIDTWGLNVKMDISDPNLIEKLCKEGAYTLINRVLFLRICEDKGHIKAKLSKNALAKWREMVENPSNLLNIAFKEIAESFEGLYKSPLFDSINFEDIDWNTKTINFILNKIGEHDFSRINKDILGKAYEQHISKEERKKLGQFYTPDFVIDYILDQIIISPEKKILDPACGSGGFLIRTYDRLRKIYFEQGWDEKTIHKHILKNNIFGIDINPFATQLTVMNLLLKDLEHPTGNLNIVEGDTLEKLEQSFDFDIFEKESPLKKITDINKKLSHGKILRNAPFDIVVANPPYIRPHKIPSSIKKRLKKDYKTYEKKADIYCCFIQRGIELLKERGYLGFITSNTWLTIDSFSKLRKFVLNNCKIVILASSSKRVFDTPTVNTIIFILQKELKETHRNNNIIRCFKITESNGQLFSKVVNKIPQGYFLSSYQNIFDLNWSKEKQQIKETAYTNSELLGKVVTLCFGIKTGDDSLFLKKYRTTKKDRKLLRRSDFSRYNIDYKKEYVLYDPIKMKAHKKTARPGEKERFEQPKILVQDISKQITATYDEQNYYIKDAILIHKRSNFPKINLKFVLAVLNSKLMNFLYSTSFPSIQVAKNELAQLPLKIPSFQIQSSLAKLAEKITSLNKQLYKSDFIHKQKEIQNEIDSTNKKIDKQVYKLYGLTQKQIKTVEEYKSELRA